MSHVLIVRDKITSNELKTLAHEQFLNVIKAVVDIEQDIMAVCGEFHSELEVLLIEKEGSRRENTWGINLRLDKTGEEFVEFDSMINLKPMFGNMSRDIENHEVREKVKDVVNKLVKYD